MNEKISSTKKGDLLEKLAFNLVQDLLYNDEFYVNGKKSKIFSKKEYYSEKRGGNIKFDITVETFLKDADKYSLLTIIECKNLKKPVSVDDVEEFESKIRQVGEHNTKGVIISNSSFQEGAFNLAVSLGIGLVRVASNDKFEWINYRKEKELPELKQQELKEQFITDSLPDQHFLSYLNNRALDNFADLLLELQVIDYYKHQEKFINIPFVSDKRIDEIVTRLYNYDLYDGLLLNTDKLCKFLETKYPVQFEFNEDLPNKVLGKIEFQPTRISVTKFLKMDLNRWRFTLSHEVGHLILHSKLLAGKLDEKIDDDFSLSFSYSVSEFSKKRLELQANIFAGHLLLPLETFSNYVIKYFNKERIFKGYLYLDNQACNKQLVYTFLDQISKDFKVSWEVGKIRLMALGLLKDDSDHSLKRIFKELGFNEWR